VDGEESLRLINEARALLVEAFGVHDGQDFLIEVRPTTSTLVWRGQPPAPSRSPFPAPG
jgi:hypothetical protein